MRVAERALIEEQKQAGRLAVEDKRQTGKASLEAIKQANRLHMEEERRQSSMLRAQARESSNGIVAGFADVGNRVERAVDVAERSRLEVIRTDTPNKAASGLAIRFAPSRWQ